ncbi:hydroxysteroid 11-beta-dehydrogenase 1-like protein isoform X5 [Bubalus kerabau]|uniref:hydroxysteroid 11-beta-dehydrogenase 1-like protein isoform X5 n=1 Tax=Bubalus carabanensis TaxID=3119969 RepID=UPI00244EAEE1|nr:hydroxysteroid 11-beta-dehydrogenase 1-like protein isoform X5 [Bubalus carabanensis]
MWAALSPTADPGRAMKVLLLTGLGALFFAYYWDDNFDPASLQGARVLLTGVSAGIGEELAYHYARLGSHLVLTAHTEALLQQVVGNCRKLGAPKVFYIAADMASPEVPERVVQFALDKLGGLDYLVLNHLGAAPAGTRVRSSQSTRWLMQPLLGSQVRAGQLLQFSAAGAGRAGSERGHYHVCSGSPRSCLSRRRSQGHHEGQGGSRAQGSPGRNPRRRHACLRGLLPVALPPALPAPQLDATLKGLVRPPGAQYNDARCCLSLWA